jgi:hypothetical protein
VAEDVHLFSHEGFWMVAIAVAVAAIIGVPIARTVLGLVGIKI